MMKVLFHVVLGLATGGLWWAYLVVRYVTK